jgi:hypothetical protein
MLVPANHFPRPHMRAPCRREREAVTGLTRKVCAMSCCFVLA